MPCSVGGVWFVAIRREAFQLMVHLSTITYTGSRSMNLAFFFTVLCI